MITGKKPAATSAVLDALAATIDRRAEDAPQNSWTARLLDKGVEGCAQKLGEEAVETVIAATTRDKQALVSESADLLYHWLVLLKASGVEADEVYAELAAREGRSGIEEKAARKNKKIKQE